MLIVVYTFIYTFMFSTMLPGLKLADLKLMVSDSAACRIVDYNDNWTTTEYLEITK